MVGLMSGAKPGPEQTGAPAPRGPDMNPPAEGEAQSNVTPEEQAQYDAFVSNAINLVYDEARLPQIVQSLDNPDDPAEGLAQTAAMVVLTVEQSAGKNGKQISDDVIFNGGVEILEDLADLAKESGVHDFTEEEMQKAVYRALDIYREAKTQAGDLDPSQAKQDFGTLLEANQQGNLGEVVPGAEKFAAKVGEQGNV